MCVVGLCARLAPTTSRTETLVGLQSLPLFTSCTRAVCLATPAVVIGHKLGVRVRVPQPGLLRKKKHPKSPEDDEDPEDEDSFLVCMECDILLRK